MMCQGDRSPRDREEEGVAGEEAGDALPLRRGAQRAAPRPGRAQPQGVRGHRHDAEGGVRVPQEQVRGSHHHHPGLCGHLPRQEVCAEQPLQAGHPGEVKLQASGSDHIVDRDSLTLVFASIITF